MEGAVSGGSSPQKGFKPLHIYGETLGKPLYVHAYGGLMGAAPDGYFQIFSYG